jgi:hypothetical protein
LLGKLNSDDRNETDYFTNKFISKVDDIFSQLPTKTRLTTENNQQSLNP